MIWVLSWFIRADGLDGICAIPTIFRFFCSRWRLHATSVYMRNGISKPRKDNTKSPKTDHGKIIF